MKAIIYFVIICFKFQSEDKSYNFFENKNYENSFQIYELTILICLQRFQYSNKIDRLFRSLVLRELIEHKICEIKLEIGNCS